MRSTNGAMSVDTTMASSANRPVSPDWVRAQVAEIEITTKNIAKINASLCFFQAKDGIRDLTVTGVQTCALPICGPAMLRAAAKNHESVLVVVDPADYPLLLAELDTHQGGSEFATRARLAAKAFSHTAHYYARVAAYLGSQQAPPGEAFPATLSLMFEKVQDLRYGENPHQSAALYREPAGRGAGVGAAHVLQGKDLSYNNIVDADTAIECARQFAQAACVIVKHANPCGVAVAATPLDAYEAAYRTDPAAAYGGIIAFNRELDAATATAVLERQFVDVLAEIGRASCRERV